MVQEPTDLLRVVETHHNHQMVWVEELGHCSQKGVEEYHSNQQVEEELHHLVVMVMVMVIVMVVEEVIDHLPQGVMVVMVVMMMEMVVEMIHHCHLIMDSHDTIEVEEIDGFTLFKDHLDPQVNLDKMVEMVGMDKHHSCPEE